MVNNNHGLDQKDLCIIRNILLPFKDKITKVGLFGSRAKGNYKSYSDIDLIIYGILQERELDQIFTLFQDSNLHLKVDVKAYNLIEYPPLQQHIDSNVVTLFDKI